jgi:hypothetical protein
MASPPAISTVRSAKGSEFIPPEMLDPSASMTTPGKYSYLIYKV